MTALWIDAGRWRKALLLALALTITLAVVSRHQIFNGFSVLLGDRYDAVIVATILEHWFHVLSGESPWSIVGYFYPYKRTIAQTDGYFLIGIAYFPFRYVGIDPFLSTHLAGLVVKGAGFLGAYLLARKAFSLSFYWSLLVAVLFTLNNASTVHGQRVQLATVAFAPILALLMWTAVTSLLNDDVRRFRTYGVASAAFFGAWCLTCFYMAWFFTLFVSAFILAALLLANRFILSSLWVKIRAQWPSVLGIFVTAFVAVAPFVYAYLPKSRETGVRPYSLVSGNTVPIEGILQVGRDNLLFGSIYNWIVSYLSPTYRPAGEYYDTGVAIGLFILFGLAVGRVLRTNGGGEASLLRLVAIATVSTWLLTLNIAGHSAWFFIYQIFPGAKALNVVSAYQIFLALPVVLLGVSLFSKLRLSRGLCLALVALLVVEELNVPYMKLDREIELSRVETPYIPPQECRVFYASGWRDQAAIADFPAYVNNAYAHNVTAMLIAQHVRVPTINGIASFNPPDWNFSDPNNGDYDKRVLTYAQKHRVSGLCRLDLNSKQWSVAEQRETEVTNTSR